ncbi:uncharacterized protein LOC113783621 isoform X2 [Coffea eugenioides]|uniref:uncharacterized protein LOC113763712 isoform X2 n=1 Tax=Coffea eugenioides TaxID=49369 RepID=UPI000F5D017F|nr:uncharacterized protein LOC113710312 isoform X2 [Coffea arabica]XP_027163414.1 uncharacterized protein LOC113763712 isoform X2 [Coffea eugenioides]XP_027185613.1 uncharacterized protein LOC113783621 isoform X2 [Coffea eugenioides]
MDWQGQKLAEQLMQIMLVSSAVVAFISGYVLGSFQIMLLIYAAGVLLTSLITVPNWPFLNHHPLKWLDPSEAEKHPKPVSANTSSKKKAGKKSMAETMSVSPTNFHPTNSSLPACCFLLKCIHRGQHHCNRIILRVGLRQWTITVTDHSFEEGWDAFCEHNIVKRHDTLLLRHSGNLIFDVIHFCELQKQVLLPWTVPLPDLLHMNVVASRDDIHTPTRQQQVASSLRPNFCQDLSDSICFYQIFNSATPNSLKIPRFIDHFINGSKTPKLLINTGNKSTQIGVKHERLHQNWRGFILEHQLQHNETLVFVPESENIFTALIFDDTGVEKIFPWYHTFNIYSHA